MACWGCDSQLRKTDCDLLKISEYHASQNSEGKDTDDSGFPIERLALGFPRDFLQRKERVKNTGRSVGRAG